MNLPLETQRLILRDFVESDWPGVHQFIILKNKKVVQFLKS